MAEIPEPSPTAQKLLCKQYLLRGPDYSECPYCNEKHETLEDLFRRISFGSEDFYNLFTSLDFLPGSPVLFNAGALGTLSACFKFDVQDTIESIFRVGTKSGLVQKWGGGVGYCLSSLRPKGSSISSTQGYACGPVAVMDLYHSIAKLITQGGKREGAQMAVLHCYHKDIEEFIHCKSTEDVLNTFNISVAVTDSFMKRVIEGEEYERGLFDEIVKGAWGNGDPGLYFIDTAERSNPTPHLGKLTGTNPCGEVPLLDNESCNLGSINLSHFVREPRYVRADEQAFVLRKDLVDWTKLEVTVRLAVRYLDLIIEKNFYPVTEIKEATLRTRKLGLGVMGWADALALIQIHYDSQEAVDLAEEVMRSIQEAAHDESRKLAEEKGVCPAFTTVGLPVPQPSRRNTCVTCIAPTGSISTIANCSSGIEPHYSLDYTQVMGDGTRLPRTLCFGTFIPRTASEISYEWHVKHQVAFQKYTDLAVSKTVNMPNDATVEDVRNTYIMAWKTECKGITVYREGSRIKQALELGTTKYDFDENDYDGKFHRFRIGNVKVYQAWGISPDNKPFEVWLTAYKQGSMVEGLLDAVAILISISLQSGVPLEKIVKHMRGRRFEPHGLTNNPKIPTASSILDYVARYAELKFLGTHTSYDSGMVCPLCGASVINQEGCLVCSESCGWSRC